MFIDRIIHLVKELIETGVSYYGCLFKDHVKKDITELVNHGVTSIVLAVSEYEMSIWFDRIKEIIELFKYYGLKVYWDFWAWGKVFGGEAPSEYLQKNIMHRQVRSNGEVAPAACFNDRDFVNYMLVSVDQVAEETEIDGFFWDEPSFYNLPNDDSWACLCKTCQTKFNEDFGYQMPKELNEDVLKFREESILKFLQELLKRVKDNNKKLKNIICVLPEKNPKIGILNWERIAHLEGLDVLSSDPYWSVFGKSFEWYKEVTSEIQKLAVKNNLKSQVWLQLFMLPEEEIQRIEEALIFAKTIGIDSIFAWPFRAAEGQIITSEKPKETWEALGKTYKKLRVGEI